MDLGHMITPNLSGAFFTRLADVIILVGLILFILFCVIIVPRDLMGRRAVILRRFFWIAGTLYFIRGFTVFVTLIPRVAHDTNGVVLSDGWFLAWLKVLLQIEQTASDLMFSGHTALLVTIACFFSYYIPQASAAVWLYTLLGMYFILATQHHYTVDLLVAFIISTLLFTLYHILYDGHWQRPPSRSKHAERFWQWQLWLHGDLSS